MAGLSAARYVPTGNQGVSDIHPTEATCLPLNPEECEGFQHPGGSQHAFLTGLAHLYNLIPYQRRAKHAGSVGWRWKAAESPQQTGSSISGGQIPRSLHEDTF
jgi:hypothetical protein